MDVKQTYWGNHFVVYTYIKSLHCISEAYIILYANYISKKLELFFFKTLLNFKDGKSKSHEIKRRLLLGRKVMTNLESIFKDITLPTKVHLVKAMVFPVVMYRCESWTVKKAECQTIDAFELWCWRRLLRVPWTARRSNQ